MPKNDIELKKLKGAENYHTWSFAMENYLAMNQLEDCIKAEDNVAAEKDTKKLTQVKARLALSVDKSVYVHIRSCVSAIEMWNTLKNLYEDRGLMRKIGLLRNLISVRLEKTNCMKTYVEEIITTASKLTDIGFDIADDWLGAILLAGLIDEYKPMIMTIESSNTKISAEKIKSKLLDMNVKTNTYGDSAFYSNNKNFKPKQNTKQVHFGTSAGTSKNYRQGVKNFKCYTCGGRNHKSSECRFNKTGNQPQNESKKSNETVKHAFVAIPNLTNSTMWFIDSGASRHMTPYDNTRIKIDSVGNAVIKADNQELTIHDVLHVPKLSANLLSVSKVVQKDMVTMRNGLVNGVKFNYKHLNLCEVCAKAKQHRLPFTSSNSRSENVLDTIHADLCGLMENSSIGGSRMKLLSVTIEQSFGSFAKCVLLDPNLEKTYWAEAVNMAVYIINRSPTGSLKEITPEEAWSGKKADLSDLKIFGATIMVHIPKEKRGKWDSNRDVLFHEDEKEEVKERVRVENLDEHSPAAEENIEASVINTPDNNQTNVSDFVSDNDEQESECEHSAWSNSLAKVITSSEGSTV
ncbi:hypothetical protein Trydic_g16285 [Trypoxylus dichotomus]